MQVKQWGHTLREWGYEVRVDIINDGITKHHTLSFSKPPTQKEIDNEVQAILDKPEPIVEPVAEDKTDKVKEAINIIKEYLTKYETAKKEEKAEYSEIDEIEALWEKK